MRRAGLVLGYEHVCRTSGCAHKEQTNDPALRRCPEHGVKLWPKKPQHARQDSNLRPAA